MSEKDEEKENKGEQKQEKRWWHYPKLFASILVRSLFDLGFITMLALFVIFLYTYYTTVDPAALMYRAIYETSTIYDKTGEHELYKMHGEENRKVITHDEIPDSLRRATIAAEDDNFYNHKGIDPYGILRAAHKNFVAGGVTQGGSTITQQLVRNTFLSREKTIKRKFTEIVLAIKVERYYTKDEILDFYLNEVPYGSNAYGAQAAAEIFFGKAAKDLTLDEAALLASLPKATTYYSPYGNNIEKLKARQKGIIERLGSLGLYNGTEIQDALATDTLANLNEFHEEILS